MSGTRPEALWEFNFKLLKQVNVCSPEAEDTAEDRRLTAAVLSCVLQDGHKNGCPKSLHMPRQYKDVHANPDSDCYVLQVTTLNFIFTPVVMGMTLTLVSPAGAAFAGPIMSGKVLLQSERGGLSVVSVAGVSHPTSFIVFSSSSQLMSAQTCATTGFACSSRTRRSSEGRRKPTMAEPKCCWIRSRV